MNRGAYTVYAADPSIFQVRKSDPSKPTIPGIKPLPQITKMSSSDKESLTDSGGAPGGKGTPTSAEKSTSIKQIQHVSIKTSTKSLENFF